MKEVIVEKRRRRRRKQLVPQRSSFQPLAFLEIHSPTSKMVRTEQSSEHSCNKSLYSSEPALEMSDITQRKCKNVVREIEKKLANEGEKIAPILADIWNKDDKSFYVAAFSGIRVLNFKSISQHLDETVYRTLNDFLKEVQSMLKGVADQFGFSSEVISEVTNIHDLFFEIMNHTFKDVDFRKVRSEVEFSSGRPTIAFLSMGGSPSQRKRRIQTKKSSDTKGSRAVGRINPAEKSRAGTSKLSSQYRKKLRAVEGRSICN